MVYNKKVFSVVSKGTPFGTGKTGAKICLMADFFCFLSRYVIVFLGVRSGTNWKDQIKGFLSQRKKVEGEVSSSLAACRQVIFPAR